MSGIENTKKKTSAQQFNYIADFLNTHRVMLHGKTKPSDADSCLLENLWDELTATLNSFGCGPKKTKMQWKKSITDWKCYTRKKARELLKSGRKTGGGEGDARKLTPAEKKLMLALTWVNIKGADIGEIGLDDTDIENDTPEINSNEDCIAPIPEVSESPATTSAVVAGIQCAGLLKRKESDASLYVAAKKPRKKDGVSRLQKKAAEAYAVGQKQTTDLLQQLVKLQKSTPASDALRARELDIKGMEMKVRFLEAENKKNELLKITPESEALRIKELEVKEIELRVRLLEAKNKKQELDLMQLR